MAIEIYNNLTRKKEPFVPVEKGKVKMYVCGMTVYSDAHIGHARTYLAFDVIRRYFEYKGFEVHYVQNVTDVDDKIIAAANKEGVDPLAYSKRFTDRCLQDLDALGIRRADRYPRASETIDDMIIMIKQIMQNGYAYEADGDVYFAVEKFPAYGKLSGQNIEDMQVGARVAPGEHKKSPLDFALWKKAKPGEPSWDSPWGKGRPGWHIECSAMSSKYLGLPFDIHGGGMDLRFPHHENEIAQAEAATGNSFARYWMHSGLLTVNGEKMSKSLGNIVNVKELIQEWDPEVLRFFYALTHYRGPPDFSEKNLQDAAKALDRIHRLLETLRKYAGDATSEKLVVSSLSDSEKQYYTRVTVFREVFETAMDDDFNTPQAIAALFEFVNDSNRFLDSHSTATQELMSYALETLLSIGQVLTLFQGDHAQETQITDKTVVTHLRRLLEKYNPELSVDTLDAEEILDSLLQVREQARTNKNWKVADSIRDALSELGFEIQDTDEGPVWRKK